jgi:hypothetical protein
MHKCVYTILFVLIFSQTNFLLAQNLKVFSAIPGRTPSEHYKCRVRLANSSTWQDAFVLQVKSKTSVSGPGDYTNGYIESLNDWTASWISFEFASGNEAEVEISRFDNTPIRKAMARPVGKTKPALIRNGKVYVKFTTHANVNVDIDGQLEDQSTGQDYEGPPVHTISLFGNPIYAPPTGDVLYLNPGTPIPADGSWTKLVFMPGVHDITQYDTNGISIPFPLRNNQILYLSGDAVIHGSFQPINNGPNGFQHFGDYWSIYGSGTLSGELIPHWRTGFNGAKYPFKGYAKGIRLEGFVVADAAEHHFNVFNKTDLDSDVNIFKNLKTLAFRLNTDGGALQRNTITSDCFFRLQDDLLYCCRSKARLNNCTFWTDAWGCMGVWATWFTSNPDTIPVTGLTFIYARREWHGAATSGVKFRDARLGSQIQGYKIKNILVEDPFPSYGLFGFSMKDDFPNTIEPAPVFLGNGITFENFVQPNHANIPAIGVVPHNRMDIGRNTGQNDTLLFSNVHFKNFAYLQVPTTTFVEAQFAGMAGNNVDFTLNCSNLMDGGTLSANQLLGSATAADPIVGVTELDPAGGIIEYKWVKSTTVPEPTLTTGTIIPRATDAIYYPGVLTETTCFRRFARRAGCSDYVPSSNTIKIEAISGGVIQSNITAFCSGSKPDIFRSVQPAGGTGDVTYIWVKSTTGIPRDINDGDIIPGATGETLIYDEPLTTTTWFRRFATRPGFLGYAASNAITVTITTGLVAKFYKSSNQSTNPRIVFENPDFFFNSSPQWKKDTMVLNNSSIVWSGSFKLNGANEDSIIQKLVGTSNATINGLNWQFTSNASAHPNFTRVLHFPGSLAQDTWYPIHIIYQRTTGSVHQYSLTYNPATPSYCPNPVCNNLTNGGTIGSDQVIQAGAVPNVLNNVLDPTGGNGSMEYIWVYSTTGIPASPSDGTCITSATQSSFAPPALTQTTYYRRFARRMGCTDYFNASNGVTITVAAIVITQPAPVCASINLNNVVTTPNAPGGTYTYHLTQSDATNGTNALVGTAVTEATTDAYVRYTLPAGQYATGFIDITLGTCVQITAKAMLQGPFSTTNNLMNDNLRSGNRIPASDPYATGTFQITPSTTGNYSTHFVAVNGGGIKTINAGVLSVTGNDAIVDWVFIELRDGNNRNTVVATRAALIQRDGDIVDMDGSSPVLFANTNLGEYYIAIRHRNHLGIMTQNKVGTVLASPPSLDFTNPSFEVYNPDYNTASPVLTNARKVSATGIMSMWAGNTNLTNLNAGKQVITYNGAGNDRNAILTLLAGNQAATLAGYHIQDVNMNGLVVYNGANNDRVVILSNLLGNQAAFIKEQR